jgi:hypothetical protein
MSAASGYAVGAAKMLHCLCISACPLCRSSRSGLCTSASSRLVWKLSANMRYEQPGKETRREAPAANSHARERVATRVSRVEA